MMLRRELGLLVTVAVLGCTVDAKPTDNKRTILVPAPGVLDADGTRGDRLTFARYVEGKAAIYIAHADGSNPRRRSFGIWDAGNVQMSPDGKWVTFGRDAGASSDVVIVSADSGPERVVAAHPINATPSSWLPDASGILYTRESSRGSSLWQYLLADGSSSQAFAVDGSVAEGFASPDGKQIAYTLDKDGKRTIWLYDRAAKTHRQVTTEGFEDFNFLPFSPDGKSLLYTSTRTGTSDLWRLDVATGAKTQLTQDIANDWRGNWSPDGSQIVFLSNRGGQTDLWVLSTGEADVQRLTDDTKSEYTYGWTSDGKGVVFRVDLGHNHLYAIPATGGPAVPLTSGEWDVKDAVLSRDHQQIAFTANKNGDDDIWVVGIGGGEPRLAAGGPGNDRAPTFSPDGKRIAFVSNRSGNPDIWVVPTAGGTPTQLTNWSSGEVSPRWSPTGDDIAFVSNHASLSDVWIVSASGGGAPRRLTTMDRAGGSIQWSPDGKSIVFIAAQPGAATANVFQVPVAGGSPRLMSPARSNGGMNWSPDGREIAMSRCNEGYCRIEIRSAAGDSLRTFSTEEKVFEFSGTWSPDGSLIAIAAQDLAGDGKDGVVVRPAAGGAARTLEVPKNQEMGLVGFTADGKTVIVTAHPHGNTLERIEVPPPRKR